MDNAFMAVPEQSRIKPAFTVKRLSGMVPHTKNIFDKKENRIKSKTVEMPAGFLVTFAKGHSIRCRDEAHLRRIGVGMRMVPLVDTETGETKGAMPNIDLDVAA